MKGDIAHRSIRSSMSRMAEARLPRMISSVIGSTRGAGDSGMGALQDDIVRGVHAGVETRGDQRGGVTLLDDGGAGEGHAGSEPVPRVGGGVDEAHATEVDRPAADAGLREI